MCFSDFCFSNRKACDLCSPENLPGDHRKHRGKCENSGFSPALQKVQFHLKISPETKKPTGGPVGGESRKWSGRRGSNPRLSAPKADALATALRPVCELLKITHPRPIFKPVDDYSPVSGLIFRTYSSFSRSIAIFTPGSGPKRIPFALSSYSAPSSTVPVL